MRSTVYIMLLMLSIMAVSCNFGKRTEPASATHMYITDSVTKPGVHITRLQSRHIEQTMAVRGRHYFVSIDRAPSDSLPKVKSDAGLFTDNAIRVLVRDNESRRVLLERTFTKSDFFSQSATEHGERFMLEGIVPDVGKTDERGLLTLSAGLSYPQTDLAVTYNILIDASGAYSIVPNQDLGELPPQEATE